MTIGQHWREYERSFSDLDPEKAWPLEDVKMGQRVAYYAGAVAVLGELAASSDPGAMGLALLHEAQEWVAAMRLCVLQELMGRAKSGLDQGKAKPEPQ